MSLAVILPEHGATELRTRWPDEPRLYERRPGELEANVSAAMLNDHITTGCLPAAELAAVKAPNPSLNPKAFMDDYGRTDAAKLQRLMEQGFTLRIGNLQRIIPYLAKLSKAIQYETGYSNYIHAFLTPGGQQGLRHHWDQQMAVIVQLAGVKRWHLWRPTVEAPMRTHNESFRVWKSGYIDNWESAGPDLSFDLKAGQSLLVPRGWVHNPHVPEGFGPSVHLTFAIRERTPIWLAEQLIASAIEDPELRRIVRPEELCGPALTRQLSAVRRVLIAYLERLDPKVLTETVREAALTDLEYVT
ncbi:cupin domain-containing protein [Streptomyces sp. LHD-70]|uniref:JmjC domain-containing protein n=1 Tax=Streptomyces sp. LHD-70 TaxID=3072140 RepID=UPI00280EAEC2|nr:cupin domain-containing protein [Streptomyces sp. LHD-70]MDQ8701192.1 cupin domain-containing protein [Streptomyces sp. LHD-70]